MKKKKIFAGLLCLGLSALTLASCVGKKKPKDTTTTNTDTNITVVTTTPVTNPTTTTPVTTVTTTEDKKEYEYQVISGNFGTLTNKKDSTESYYKFYDTVFRLNIVLQPTVDENGTFEVKLYKLEDEVKGYEIDGEAKTFTLPSLSHGSYYSYSSAEIYFNNNESLKTGVNTVLKDEAKSAELAEALVDNKILSVEFSDYSAIEPNICYQLRVYDKEQGTYIFDDEVNAAAGITFHADDVATLEGYVNKGFATSVNSDTVAISFDQKFTLSGDQDLFIVRQKLMKVTLDFNGYNQEDQISYANKLNEYTIPDLSSTLNKYEDHIFLGWSLSKTDTSTLYNTGDTITLSDDATLYAIYDEIHTATLDYRGHLTGGSYAQSLKGNALNNITLPYVITSYVEAGYVFLGWSTDPNATTAEYDGNRTLKLESDMTFYAVYKQTAKVTYDYNGLDLADVVNTTTQSGYTTIMVTAPEWEDHTFMGWSKNKNATTGEYQPGDYVQFTGDTRLYAIWTQQPILKFDANGGLATTMPQPIYPTGGKATIPAATPSKSNARFLGWSLSQIATEPTYSEGDEVSVTSVVTLYAVWQQTATVYIRPNNKISNATGATYDVGETVTLRNIYRRTNYTFKGWKITGVNGIVSDNYQLTITSSMTRVFVDAVWEGNNVTIIFNSNISASVVSGYVGNIKTKFGETFTIPDGSAYVSEQYEFAGWHWGEFGQNINDMPKNISIDFAVGDEVYPDDYPTYTYNDGGSTVTYMYINAVFKEKVHTYETTVTEPTLEFKGKTVYTCLDDDTYSYEVPITNSNLFSSYVSDVNVVTGRGVVLTTTIMTGTVRLLDYISVILKDGTVANDVMVAGIELNGEYVETATRGQTANIQIRSSIVTKDNVGVGCVICSKGYEITNVHSIYVKVRLLSKEEGGRQSPFTISYLPRIKVGTFTAYTTIASAYDGGSYEALDNNTLFFPGKSYVFKLECSSFLNAWIGETITFVDGADTIAEGEIIARTDNQATDYFDNHIVIYLCEKSGATPLAVAVKKGTSLAEIECPFILEGYEFVGWEWGATSEIIDDEELIELIQIDNIETIITETKYYGPVWKPENL